MRLTTTAARLAIGFCGAVVGVYCAYTAFRNGQLLDVGLDGLVVGSAFAAVVIGSWFLLPLAASSPRSRRPLLRLGWFLCLVFVLINAIGFTATLRTGAVGGKANTVTAYDTALSGLKQARERLDVMKNNQRWQATSGCTDATVPRSITFCGEFAETQAAATRHQAVISAGKPATVDAQADTIAWVMRADSATVGRAMPIFMAVVLDIAASLFIWAALTTYGSGPAANTVHTLRKSRRIVPAQRRTSDEVERLKRMAQASAPDAVQLVPRVKKGGGFDRRFKTTTIARRRVDA